MFLETLNKVTQSAGPGSHTPLKMIQVGETKRPEFLILACFVKPRGAGWGWRSLVIAEAISLQRTDSAVANQHQHKKFTK